MIRASDIAGRLQHKVRVESDAIILAQFLREYQGRLVRDMNRIAAAKIEEAGLDGVLTFTARIGFDAHSIILIPSNPDLFRKLELGQFDAEGNMVAPPHSILRQVKVTVQLR